MMSLKFIDEVEMSIRFDWGGQPVASIALLALTLATIAPTATSLKVVSRAEKGFVLNDTENVAFNYSGGSGGVLTKLVFQGGEGWPQRPLATGFGAVILRVYVDGEATPSIEAPLYTLIAMEWLDECETMKDCAANCSGLGRGAQQQCPYGDGPWSNSLFGKTGVLSGIFTTRRIPFGPQGVRVTLQPREPCYRKCGIFWTIRALVGGKNPSGTMSLPMIVVGGVQLPSQARLKLVSTIIPLAAVRQYIVLYTARNRSGAVVQTNLAVGTNDTSNFWVMESCFRSWVDGGEMELLSSGTEDYFDATDYWDQGLWFGETAGLTQMHPLQNVAAAARRRRHEYMQRIRSGAAHEEEEEDGGAGPPYRNQYRMSAYRVHDADPLFFETSFVLMWRNGESCNPSQYPIGHCVPPTPTTNDSTWPSAGLPSPSHVIGRIWAYEW
tara:strand:- start:2657 stop:3973 length:1317 start_codon:yes stop_codon:yes gene_type:complete